MQDQREFDGEHFLILRSFSMTETHRSGANNNTHRQLGETRSFQDKIKRGLVHLEAVKKIQ